MSKCKIGSIAVSAVCCLCISFSVFAQENVAKSNVVGLWHFDEGKGEAAKDSSGNGNDLSLVGNQLGRRQERQMPFI